MKTVSKLEAARKEWSDPETVELRTALALLNRLEPIVDRLGLAGSDGLNELRNELRGLLPDDPAELELIAG